MMDLRQLVQLGVIGMKSKTERRAVI